MTVNDKIAPPWSQDECSIVLDAIEQGVNASHVISLIKSKTNRSDASIERRLKKMGYLNSHGQSFSQKQGFVR